MDPDWAKISAIGREASELRQASGKLTPEDYARLFAEAEKAVAGHRDLLEFITNFDPSGGPTG